MRLLVRQSIPGGLFSLQQSLHPAPCLIDPTGGGVLNLVAAVVTGLSTLGSLPELAPQALRPVIQAAADKLFGRGLDFFL